MSKARSIIGITGFVACIVALGSYLLAPGGQGTAMGSQLGSTVSVVEGNEVDLAFKMAGSIDSINVKEGDQVKAGDLVAQLSSDELLAKREQAAAAYQLAQVKVEQANKGVTVTAETSNAQVSQAQATVSAATAQLQANKNGARPEEVAQLKARLVATQNGYDTAKKQKERMEQLFAEGAVPKVNVEQATMQFEQASAELAAVQEQLKMAQSGARQEQIDASRAQVAQANAAYEQAIAAKGQVGIKQLDTKSAQAGVQQAKGALDEIDAYLKNTKLLAPVNGVVKSVSVQKGELVAQGLSVITIQAQDEQFVKFYLDENKIGSLTVGQETKLYVPSLDKEVNGKITMIAPAADFAVKKATTELGDRDVRAFMVKVDVSNQQLRPGLSIEWQLEGDGRK
ncbi:HlyD family efflux transporter periplasmic adaptor subunit [Brevibacillus fluminis]|uniref:HlyD family efflux transporter periplasmic adaptor subunit n=1 Tax=Brevibacillus fluminis TaxID=511487 RepID=A0A3M8DAE0_9BACL|nr:HlyD family efflux transporter periplasmic adaptor subunit [Brevibacillus fluminis]RNB85016.1 HlyD family efflux transporter periplasmic adaptor subunit [Brevibacillus fluminis]